MDTTVKAARRDRILVRAIIYFLTVSIALLVINLVLYTNQTRELNTQVNNQLTDCKALNVAANQALQLWGLNIKYYQNTPAGVAFLQQITASKIYGPYAC